LIALIDTWLYFHSLFAAAFIVTITATQVWRFVSESLRADYRGNGKVTAYQAMSLAMIAYSFGLAAILPDQTGLIVSLQKGLRTLWNPAVLIFLEFLWGGVFLYYGRSKVTGSILSFHIHTDKI
jgi:Sec-independent protein secretion pathway component TatC